MPKIDGFCPQSACQLKTMGVMVDTDHSFSAHEQRALNGKEANRTAAPYSHGVAFLDVGIVSGHPAGGKAVGQDQNLIVVHPFRHHDWANIGTMTTNQYGMSARITAR